MFIQMNVQVHSSMLSRLSWWAGNDCLYLSHGTEVKLSLHLITFSYAGFRRMELLVRFTKFLWSTRKDA